MQMQSPAAYEWNNPESPYDYHDTLEQQINAEKTNLKTLLAQQKKIS